ncbi:putative Cyclic nucleotide-binding protein [Tenacibaculum litopenaei]|jgi:CRP-like cAMP-binding protein|uniref:Crp/Fnr family transcriptional regulator n=1 Tax=Tenacibaculum litopenaei TaxID=396016 RepID=UPI0038942EE5
MNLREYIVEFYQKDFTDKTYPFEVRKRQVKKGTVILPYGKVPTKFYFLNEGIVEIKVLASGEDEKTMLFQFANSFFGSYVAALSKIPSVIQCTAISNCLYEEFTFDAYQKACEHSLLVNKIGRIELEKNFLRTVQREQDFLTKSKKEMYLDLISNNPLVLEKIPLKKIANYLGILPETLSRIRKQVIS